MGRLLCVLLATSIFGCADETPPTWPAGAALEVEPEATQLRVTWPDPLDDDVLVFAVSVNGEERTRATTSTHTVTVGDLDDETLYVVQVTAIDHDENVSAPLMTNATTSDGTPPEWPEGAQLSATSGSLPGAEARSVDLRWPAAIDATSYRVTRDDTELSAIEALHYSTAEAPLTAATRFAVRAFDEAGNEGDPLEVVWGETEQARREAEGPEPQVTRSLRANGSEMMILGALGSGGTLSDVLAPMEVDQGVSNALSQRPDPSGAGDTATGGITGD